MCEAEAFKDAKAASCVERELCAVLCRPNTSVSTQDNKLTQIRNKNSIQKSMK